jgi:DNA-nicking Smr family endonuclease
MSRKSRELSAEELALWDYVTRNVKRSHGRSRTPLPTPPSPVKPKAAARQTVSQSPPPELPPPQPRSLVLGANDGIDHRTAKRFARGEMTIDARLDLHGLNLAQAESAVTSFIRRAAAADYRCVLVVTGKGRRSHDTPSDAFEMDAPRGRIRTEAPHWLNRPSLRPLILAVREAHYRHGGGGALYVMLKRRR